MADVQIDSKLAGYLHPHIQVRQNKILKSSPKRTCKPFELLGVIQCCWAGTNCCPSDMPSGHAYHCRLSKTTAEMFEYLATEERWLGRYCPLCFRLSKSWLYQIKQCFVHIPNWRLLLIGQNARITWWLDKLSSKICQIKGTKLQDGTENL